MYIIIAGDFNLDILKPDRNTLRFLSYLDSFNLIPAISLPTRITRETATCIENLFTNIPSNLYTTNVMEFNISDHLGQLLEITFPIPNMNMVNEKCPYEYRRTLHKSSIPSFLLLLSQENWNTIFSAEGIADKLKAFQSTLMYYADSCVCGSLTSRHGASPGCG